MKKLIIIIFVLSLITQICFAGNYYPMDLETDFRLWVPTKIELSIKEKEVTHENWQNWHGFIFKFNLNVIEGKNIGPLKKKSPTYAATLGEWRKSHLHSGVDIGLAYTEADLDEVYDNFIKDNDITIKLADGSIFKDHLTKDEFKNLFRGDLDVGCPIYPIKGGKVTAIGNIGKDNEYIEIDHHDGTRSRYYHIAVDRENIERGMEVNNSDIIGYTKYLSDNKRVEVHWLEKGQEWKYYEYPRAHTSAHLHFEEIQTINNKTFHVNPLRQDGLKREAGGSNPWTYEDNQPPVFKTGGIEYLLLNKDLSIKKKLADNKIYDWVNISVDVKDRLGSGHSQNAGIYKLEYNIKRAKTGEEKISKTPLWFDKINYTKDKTEREVSFVYNPDNKKGENKYLIFNKYENGDRAKGKWNTLFGNEDRIPINPNAKYPDGKYILKVKASDM